MKKKTVALQIRLPDELHAEIRRLTEEDDRPLNRTITELLRAGLEHYRGDSPKREEGTAAMGTDVTTGIQERDDIPDVQPHQVQLGPPCLAASLDRDGKPGPVVTAAFYLFPRGTTGQYCKLHPLGIPWGAPIIVIEDDYGAWGDDGHITVTTYGLALEPGQRPPDGWKARRYRDASGELVVLIYLQEVAVADLEPHGEIAWHSGQRAEYSLIGLDPTGAPERDRKLRQAMRLVEQLQINTGGSPEGPRKGQVWDRHQCLEWWASWTQIDGTPTQKDLALDMGLSIKNPEEAVARWRSTGLHWPPTEEELLPEEDEEEDE